MNKLLLSLISLALLSLASGQNTDWVFDFANKGYDFAQAIPPSGWTGINKCGEPEGQSPINLMEPLGVYGWVYGHPIPAEFDDFQLHYLNPAPDSKVIYDRKNFKMLVNKFAEADAGKESYFLSKLPKNIYKVPTIKYSPTSFHFHHPAEHPVNGLHRDMAMHVVHSLVDAPNDVFKALATGIQFSVDDYDRDISTADQATISEFFDQLDMANRSEVLVGDALKAINWKGFSEVIDFNDAWLYEGSAAFPPCIKPLIWRVAHKVYPIELKHLYMIKKIFEDHAEELKSTSNIRGIHRVSGHEIRYLGAGRLLLGLNLAITLGLLLI